MTAVEKTKASQQAIKARREEASQQILNLQPVLSLVIEKTKELQKQVYMICSYTSKEIFIHFFCYYLINFLLG